MTWHNGGTQALKVLTRLMQSQWSKPYICKTGLHSKLGTHQDFITMELMFLLCKYLNLWLIYKCLSIPIPVLTLPLLPVMRPSIVLYQICMGTFCLSSIGPWIKSQNSCTHIVTLKGLSHNLLVMIHRELLTHTISFQKGLQLSIFLHLQQNVTTSMELSLMIELQVCGSIWMQLQHLLNILICVYWSCQTPHLPPSLFTTLMPNPQQGSSGVPLINNIVLDNLIRFLSEHSMFSVGSNPFLKMDLDGTKLKSMSSSY